MDLDFKKWLEKVKPWFDGLKSTVDGNIKLTEKLEKRIDVLDKLIKQLTQDAEKRDVEFKKHVTKNKHEINNLTTQIENNKRDITQTQNLINSRKRYD